MREPVRIAALPREKSDGATAERAHPEEPKRADARHVDRTSDQTTDVEAALSRALDAAATAGRFDVVAQLAKELEARRLAQAGNVVALGARSRR